LRIDELAVRLRVFRHRWSRTVSSFRHGYPSRDVGERL
jgi:hypothetical protein